MLPVDPNDPVNERILAISEDKLEGFMPEPFQEISTRSGLAVETVMLRIAAMLRAGTIRRVRQTLLATNLANGALVAWKVSEDKIDAAFDFMFNRDPFSGHVVLRSTDTLTAGSDYKLWTTLKVPHGFSIERHCEILGAKVGAERFRIMPAKGIFTLGVGHTRRKTIEPGRRTEAPASMIQVRPVELNETEWNVLLAMKREFRPEEIRPTPWLGRAREAGVSLDEFYAVASGLIDKRSHVMADGRTGRGVGPVPVDAPDQCPTLLRQCLALPPPCACARCDVAHGAVVERQHVPL